MVDFSSEMQGGTYVEQIDRIKNIKNIPEAELEYVSICLFGPIEQIRALTKKFQVWK